MDCPKCGYALTAFDKDCARCRAIAKDEFAKSPAAVWPPAIGPAVAAAPTPLPRLYPAPVPYEAENSSGEERGGPPEIEGLHWNWGAFFCGWLWCFFHRAYGMAVGIILAGLFLALFTVFILPAGYALPCELMALVVFGLCCHLGMHGHEFAWERRRFPGGVPQYLAVQRAWAVGGGVAFGITALFVVTLVVFFLAAIRAFEARRQAAYQAAHPPAVSAPVSTAPPPLVLRPPQPAPSRMLRPMRGPMDRGDFNNSGNFQRHFNPNSRREFDPRFQPPPGNVPNNVPNNVPYAVPAPSPPPASQMPPSLPTAAPQPYGQGQGAAGVPGGGASPGPAVPASPPMPTTAPMTGPSGAPPENGARP